MTTEKIAWALECDRIVDLAAGAAIAGKSGIGVGSWIAHSSLG
jgi:hypothetical protein